MVSSWWSLLAWPRRISLPPSAAIIAELTAAAAAELALVEGVGVWMSIKANDVVVYYD
jgi:molybdopterin-binding protein